MSYSQGEEEEVILSLDGDGIYLDVGAFDGLTFSNTRCLAERGWSGVCVEPAPYAFDELVKNRPPGARLVNAALAEKSGVIPFLYCRDAVSTTSKKFAAKWAETVSYHPVFTMAVSVDEFLEFFPGPYRLLSIDTEGSSVALLKLFDLDALETEMVCVEHDGTKVEVPGFRSVFRNAENVILRRR